MSTTEPTTTYDVVVLNADDKPVRIIFRDPSYAKALGYLERNLPRRPNLDMVSGGRFVDWQDTPGLLAPLDEGVARLLDGQR